LVIEILDKVLQQASLLVVCGGRWLNLKGSLLGRPSMFVFGEPIHGM
jgi:hypothetical protein